MPLGTHEDMRNAILEHLWDSDDARVPEGIVAYRLGLLAGGWSAAPDEGHWYWREKQLPEISISVCQVALAG